MNEKIRVQNLMLQQIDVALVYKDMLSMEEATTYLEQTGLSRDSAERALLDGQKRLPVDGAVVRAPMPDMTCRRKNRIHDAIVEAALKIERRQGLEHAMTLLAQENVPPAVAARILAQGPRQVRARKIAP